MRILCFLWSHKWQNTITVGQDDGVVMGSVCGRKGCKYALKDKS